MFYFGVCVCGGGGGGAASVFEYCIALKKIRSYKMEENTNKTNIWRPLHVHTPQYSNTVLNLDSIEADVKLHFNARSFKLI